MMSCIGITVVQEELGPMIITRRIIWDVHGSHQSLHPKVRHGEAVIVTASSLSLKPKIGKSVGT